MVVTFFLLLILHQVHQDLPGILKEYTKAVIRANPTTEEDIIAFSINYFKAKMETNSLKASAGIDGSGVQ